MLFIIFQNFTQGNSSAVSEVVANSVSAEKNLNLNCGQLCPPGRSCNYRGAVEKDPSNPPPAGAALACPAGDTLHVVSASYFTSRKSESCATYLRKECEGRSDCDFSATEIIFGFNGTELSVQLNSGFGVNNLSLDTDFTVSVDHLPPQIITVHGGTNHVQLAFNLTQGHHRVRFVRNDEFFTSGAYQLLGINYGSGSPVNLSEVSLPTIEIIGDSLGSQPTGSARPHFIGATDQVHPRAPKLGAPGPKG